MSHCLVDLFVEVTGCLLVMLSCNSRDTKAPQKHLIITAILCHSLRTECEGDCEFQWCIGGEPPPPPDPVVVAKASARAEHTFEPGRCCFYGAGLVLLFYTYLREKILINRYNSRPSFVVLTRIFILEVFLI